jgi:hypothetical protein
MSKRIVSMEIFYCITEEADGECSFHVSVQVLEEGSPEDGYEIWQTMRFSSRKLLELRVWISTIVQTVRLVAPDVAISERTNLIS